MVRELISVDQYAESSGLAEAISDAITRRESTESNGSAIPPLLSDLVNLHYLVRSRRVLRVLELGGGWSSVAVAHALQQNSEEYAAFVATELRCEDPFTLYSVDDVKLWQDLVRSGFNPGIGKHVQWHFAPAQMGTFRDRICTYYETLPNICPDLIYLDGPSQDSVSGSISGISTAHPDRLPMSGDILRIEHFLLPGTLILVDGRTANARFLRANLQRNWQHHHDLEQDRHTFELVEKPLGAVNERHIRWALGDDWITKAN